MAGSNSSVERIGEFLVKIGVITPDQVNMVLEVQGREPDRLFGEIAVDMGFVNDSAIERYLSKKK
jgi:hypothetical protein